MMIKMLIVDDEPVICQGLTATIPWNDIGVEVVGTACNGKEALSRMYQENVDLILTDVYMPEMNGLELSEHISQDFPASKIIIMSGYDEFEYARQALRLGVEDYLLKPVDVNDLIELVKQVRKNIIEQTRANRNFKQELISKQIYHYLFGSPASSKEMIQSENMNLSYRIFISERSDYYLLKDAYADAALTVLKEEWKRQIDQVSSEFGLESISIFGHENELITILYNNDTSKLDNGNMVKVCESIEEANPHLLRGAISAKRQSLSAIPELREEIRTSLEDYRIDDDPIFFIENNNQEKVQEIYPEKTEVQLREAILKQDKALMSESLNDMFNHFEKAGLTLLQVLNVSRELELVLKDQLQEQHYSRHLDEIRLVLRKDVDLKIYNSHQAIKHLLMVDLSSLTEALDAKNNNHWIIESAKKYIQKNYQKDIKASDVAEEHFITPNYFSMLFKQETGHSYSEYLNMIRIKKASELLVMESNKVYEIAEYVGYKEYKYFAHIFKIQLGMTPTQYRRSNVSGK